MLTERSRFFWSRERVQLFHADGVEFHPQWGRRGKSKSGSLGATWKYHIRNIFDCAAHFKRALDAWPPKPRQCLVAALCCALDFGGVCPFSRRTSSPLAPSSTTDATRSTWTICSGAMFLFSSRCPLNIGDMQRCFRTCWHAPSVIGSSFPNASRAGTTPSLLHEVARIRDVKASRTDGQCPRFHVLPGLLAFRTSARRCCWKVTWTSRTCQESG